MTRRPVDVAFTPAVKAAQERKHSRDARDRKIAALEQQIAAFRAGKSSLSRNPRS